MTLTPEQTQELQRLVDQRRAALLDEITRDLGKMREDRLADVAGPVGDPGDESVASLMSDLDQAEATRDISELRMLEAARQRIAEGRYGLCSHCGEEIGYARLRASPAAERCITCQTRFEKTHASGAGTTL
ncbi:MAG TPA: TraR/DksA family transcriptional regulator [Burkholderiales bacterium]|jgi:RNA polymerase-binding protein DksA|nr:TraR/DksA family transcriptional regulator [Burkholderiales bacterium]